MKSGSLTQISSWPPSSQLGDPKLNGSSSAMLYNSVWRVASLLLTAGLARSACECGYFDPSTNALWTDATLTYFNESGLSSVVTGPAVSPRIYGDETAGDTGDGQEEWATVGNLVNPWEDAFGATWRTAVSYNNTYIRNVSQGLAMQVSTPDLSQRIVNGSQMVSRRRDMLFGSFRTFVLPTTSYNLNGGSGFKFGISFNDRFV